MRHDGAFCVAGCSNATFAVAQFEPNGVLDTGFNSVGYNYTDLVGTQDCAMDVKYTDDGVVLAGYVLVNDNYNMALARFEPTPGLLDAPVADAATEFTLTRLSPNPAYGATKIEYRLARAAHVRIDVYDAQGRLVAQPVDGEREAGKHAITWKPSASREPLAAGIYFVHLEAAGASVTRRLAILK